MNPFVQRLLLSAVRYGVVWLAGKFGASLSDDEATKLAAELAPVIAMLVWSGYQTFRDRQKQLTAQVMGRGVTEHEVEAQVDAGRAPTVMTPKDAVPLNAAVAAEGKP